MNKSISNGLLMLLTFVVLFSGRVQATVPVPWEVNPNAWQYDMSLYLVGRLNLEPLDLDRYIIGAFVGEECRGVGEVLDYKELAAPVVYLRARSNVISGEVLSFFCFDTETGNVYESVTEVTFESNGLVGFPSEPFEVIFYRDSVPLESITLSKTELTLEREASETLVASLLPEDALPVELTWMSSAPEIATVTNEGVVTGVANGEAIITVTGDDKEATCNVTVVSPKAKTITLIPTELTLFVGGIENLTYITDPEDAVVTVTWESSDEMVAVVTDGTVTAIAPGNAVIIAITDNGLIAEAKVTVNPVCAETLILDQKELIGYPGDIFTLKAIVMPENTTNPEIIWKSDNENIAKVDNEGVVNLIAPGETIITASCGDISTNCNVIVNPILVSSIIISSLEWSGYEGDSFKLTADVLPDNATNKAILWSSSDASVASVTEYGVVTAIKAGNAVISATAADGSGVMATCEVTVNEPVPITVLVESISLSAVSWSGYEGDTFSLDATVLPENATNNTVNWTTSDPAVATVTSDGTVTAVKAGLAVITASAADGSGVSAICIVIVNSNAVYVTSISLSATEWSGLEGETFTLTATVLPENATNNVVNWSSSSLSVATVSADGKVTAVRPGKAVITASAADGSGVTATCEVKVLPLIVLAESLTVDPDSWSGEAGDSFTIIATVLPENVTDMSLAWSSTDDGVAAVDDNGNVKVLNAGSCVIEVRTLDGSGLHAECSVVAVVSGIESVFSDFGSKADVYTAQGVLLKKNCNSDDLKQFVPGIYIIRCGQKTKTVYITGGL